MNKSAERLKELRLNGDLSMRELAQRTGLTHATISRIESGLIPLGAKYAKSIAQYFGVSLDYLLDSNTPTIKTMNKSAQRLKELREAKGASIREIENYTGIMNSTISSIENRKRKMKLVHAVKLAGYFNVSVAYLLDIEMESNEKTLDCEKQVKMTLENLENLNINELKITKFKSKSGHYYSKVYYPESDMADGKGCILLHRLVMSKHLGRELTNIEVVHHIDNDPQNNALSNLMLFSNNAEHRKYHRKLSQKETVENIVNTLLAK